MPVAAPQLHNEGLLPDAHRVVLAGPIGSLQYPMFCPNCDAPATEPLPIAKVFMHNGGEADEAGWRYRIARAAPLFCRVCLDSHGAELLPVTWIDRVKSVVFSELALPGFGAAAFALFLLVDSAPVRAAASTSLSVSWIATISPLPELMLSATYARIDGASTVLFNQPFTDLAEFEARALGPLWGKHAWWQGRMRQVPA